MKLLFKRWFDVYEDEIALFLWTALLLFIVRSSGIVLNNYAETAFLKRYGVEYLPIVNMINAVATFIIMGLVAGVVARHPGAKLLGWLFMFCGFTVAIIRALIPLDIDLIYPLLFMLKSQYEVLLALLFWNLANDLFNTRQSKRIFPMVTAGGVIGQILGSFGTPWLAKISSLDNLLYVYLVLTVLGAVAVKRMSFRFPNVLFLKNAGISKVKKRPSMIDEIRKIRPMLKDSVLIKIMIVLTFMPNVVIPILNYQFNFAVNQQFASEGGLLAFFGYFRGVLNIVSLIILLFVGRIYGRWGLPVALMFHPFNYLIVFLSFLLRFDAFTAMYARMTANVLRTTINLPAMAVVTGLFPENYRAVVRPFLRGTVVRIALFLGSGLILITEPFFHPRYLSLVAIPFVLTWLAAPFILKRKYSQILIDLISRKMLDLKSLELNEVDHVFKDNSFHDSMRKAFVESQGKKCIWYGQLLHSMGSRDLDHLVLSKLKIETNEATKIALLELLPDRAGETVLPFLKEQATGVTPEIGSALIQTACRVSSNGAERIIRYILDTTPHKDLKAHALGLLYPKDPEKFKEIINNWMGSSDTSDKHAGIIAAGISGELTYVEPLKSLLNPKEDEEMICALLKALRLLKATGLSLTIRSYLNHPSKSVRLQALGAWEITDDYSLRSAIFLLGDSSDDISNLAKDKILAADYLNSFVLLESLSISNSKIHAGIFEIIESLSIKDIDIIRFAKNQIEKSYQLLACAHNLHDFPEGVARDLVIGHLEQMSKETVDNTIRILATKDSSGQMNTTWRSIFSADSDQRGNSIEALDNLVDNSLAKILLPLVDDIDQESRLLVGRKHFKLISMEEGSEALIRFLLAQENWAAIILTLTMISEMNLEKIEPQIFQIVLNTKYIHKSRIIDDLLDVLMDKQRGKKMKIPNGMALTEKIQHLKKIDIFEDLSVGELTAVASIAETTNNAEDEIIFKEGDVGETLYLLIDGEVSVIKGYGGSHEVVLDRIQASDYFGEMALFDDEERSATIKTKQPSIFLVLHKREFKEMVKEYPIIALHACKVISRRLRKLHQKVAKLELKRAV